MRTYIRIRIKGGCYFFAVNLAERRGNDLLVRKIEDLRAAFQETRRDHPFSVEGIGILPDHFTVMQREARIQSIGPLLWKSWNSPWGE